MLFYWIKQLTHSNQKKNEAHTINIIFSLYIEHRWRRVWEQCENITFPNDTSNTFFSVCNHLKQLERSYGMFIFILLRVWLYKCLPLFVFLKPAKNRFYFEMWQERICVEYPFNHNKIIFFCITSTYQRTSKWWGWMP